MRSPAQVATLAIVAALAVAAGLYFGRDYARSSATADAALVLTRTDLKDLSGNPTSLQAWQGKIVVVNFWAGWCAPCREEIPGLLRVQGKYAANGVQIVGIAVDSAEKSREAATAMEISYPVLVGGVQSIDLSRPLGNRAGALPYTVILNREGLLVATHLGLITEAQLERLLQPLLG